MAKQRRARIVIAVLVLAIGTGCRAVPIRDRAAIRVPSGLDSETVELAIVLAVVNPPPQAIAFEHTAAQITDEILTAIFGRSSRRIDWFIESREPGAVYAGRQRGPYYLSVSLRYNDKSVHVDILRSEALNQRGGWIHPTAIRWIETLERRLRIALGNLAARLPPPAVSSRPGAAG